MATDVEGVFGTGRHGRLRTEFPRGLKARGPAGVEPVVSDAETGLEAAIGRDFDASRQRCRAHWMRKVPARFPRGQHAFVFASAIRHPFSQRDRERAGTSWRHVAGQVRVRWTKPAAQMGESEQDVPT